MLPSNAPALWLGSTVQPLEDAFPNARHGIPGRCPKANQPNAGLGQYPVDKAVPPPALRPCVGPVIQFDGHDKPRGFRVAQHEVEVLLGDGRTPALSPVRFGTGDDVRQPHFTHDQVSAIERRAQRCEEGGLAPRQQAGTGAISGPAHARRGTVSPANRTARSLTRGPVSPSRVVQWCLAHHPGVSRTESLLKDGRLGPPAACSSQASRPSPQRRWLYLRDRAVARAISSLVWAISRS